MTLPARPGPLLAANGLPDVGPLHLPADSSQPPAVCITPAIVGHRTFPGTQQRQPLT